MTDFLPLFPLKLIVYPGEQLNLHIFEPRYKQLIRECEDNGISFGVPSYINNEMTDFGTEIQLLKVEKRYDNGELDIRTKGLGVFKIHEFYRTAPNKLYAGADIERVNDADNGDQVIYAELIEFLIVLYQLLNIKKPIPENNAEFRSFDIAHHVGFSMEQEYEFLCIPSELERQKYMLAHFKRLIPVVKEMERLRKKAQMNGHFKNLIPPNI
ncbi:MAG: LON peptidase substrate-binding domain-containing protein [Bacteroidota bacterium]